MVTKAFDTTPATLQAAVLALINTNVGGSASQIKKAIFADYVPSMDRGEITDKGSLNQRFILANHSALVQQICS